ncbi:MAG: hypothetical protein ACYCUM_13595 [Solirubrobacteraceae bacterium]
MSAKRKRIGLQALLGAATLLALAPAGALAAGAPVLESQKVYLGGAQTATIEAQVEPDGSETTCLVEYVGEEAFQASQWSAASRQPCSGQALVGAGAQPARAHLSGLEVASAYRYRVLASSAAGTTTGPAAYFSTFGIESFAFEAIGEHGEPYTQAGGHPYELVTSIDFNTTTSEAVPRTREIAPLTLDGVERDIELELPPGLIGNPRPFAKCSLHTLEARNCSPEAQIGVIEINEEDGSTRDEPVYDLQAPPGVAARFGARINELANAVIEAGVRSGSDYGINADSLQITGFGKVTRVTVRLWGVPASPSHDAQRRAPESGGTNADNAPEVPFLSMPTSCTGSSPFAALASDSYQAIGDFARASQEMPSLQGCAGVSFAPRLAAAPTSGAAESPSGLAVDLHVPQDLAPGKGYEAPSGLRSADLRDATVTLPAGLTVNPSSSAGLSGCSAEQIGLTSASGVDEEQRIQVEPRLDTSFTLAYEGQQTAPIGAHATAASVQADLEALPAIGSGNVQVSGGAGGALIARFVGALAGRGVPALVATAQRPAIERLTMQNREFSNNQYYSTDSFELAFDGHSTAATMTATEHLESERNSETGAIGYIEDASIAAKAGAFVTGEAISGPGIPLGTRVQIEPGRILLLAQYASATPGEFTGGFEASIPDIAFAETVRSALEALPSIGSVNVAGGPGGEAPVEGPQVDSEFTISYTPAAGEEAGPLTVTPATQETPQTITPSYAPAGSRAVSVHVVQRGGVPHLSGEPAACPPSSRIGTVEIDTPLLEEPLPGSVYLAKPYENPFDSLIALYIAVHDPVSGVVVKLAGHVEVGANGQLTTTFAENPQLPFEDLKLKLREGPRAPLMTPATCGRYTTTSALTPWSAPQSGGPATPSSPFEVSSEPGGGACPTSPSAQSNAPSFEAGSQSTQAGAYTPFVVRLTRAEGSQRFSRVIVTPPPGLLGRVAGVPRCPEADIAAAAAASGAAEQASPSCPAASELGAVTVGAGAGPDPFYVHGHVYLAGPYEGAPFSLAIVTPALAGPFDLGTVVVRAGIYINPTTAQVTVKSDPIPAELENIPLDVRSIAVELSRPGFTLNPTSCETLAATGQEVSTVGQTAVLADRFQASGCDTMPFHPSFSAFTRHGASRKGGAALLVKLAQSPGEANLAKVEVELPIQFSARDSTLNHACTEAQFAANPSGCPQESIVGTATAVTPLLAKPLTGPAIFVSHGGLKFPDLNVVLQGEGVTIELTGHTDIVGGHTFSKFETVPDAPISSFELSLPQGPHSALSPNLPSKAHFNYCGRRLDMATRLVGQNGATHEQQTKVAIEGCKPELRILGHKASGRAVEVTVRVPSAGRLTGDAKGLRRASRKARGAGVVKLTLKLNRGERTRLAKLRRGRRRHGIEIEVRLRFAPTHGRALTRKLKVRVG